MTDSRTAARRAHHHQETDIDHRDRPRRPTGTAQVSRPGIPFFDHMLDQLGRTAGST
jgi:imidazoleglycerol phosphate dehydratase HisB